MKHTRCVVQQVHYFLISHKLFIFNICTKWIIILSAFRRRLNVRLKRGGHKVWKFHVQIQYKHDRVYAKSVVHLHTVYGTNQRKVGSQLFRGQFAKRSNEVSTTFLFITINLSMAYLDKMEIRMTSNPNFIRTSVNLELVKNGRFLWSLRVLFLIIFSQNHINIFCHYNIHTSSIIILYCVPSSLQKFGNELHNRWFEV